MIIKKVSILSFVKVFFFISLIVGLMVGILFGLSSEYVSYSLKLHVSPFGIWLLSMVLIPLLVSMILLLIGIFFVLLFNLFSQLLGGVTIDIEEKVS